MCAFLLRQSEVWRDRVLNVVVEMLALAARKSRVGAIVS